MIATNIYQDFPLLAADPELRYLDNAATSQKPQAVLDALTEYYTTKVANVHRGVHALSDASTAAWESSRATVAQFFGAQPAELIAVRNTTEALNGIAYGWGDHTLSQGDVIVTSLLEHHSSIVVWQELCKRRGAELAVLSVDEAGAPDLVEFREICQKKQVKLLAIGYVSNALGSVAPLSEYRRILDETGHKQARIAIDAAQAAPHLPLNFERLPVDFLTFSGHKMLGPMGSGGLLVKKSLLTSEEMQPWLFGGGMIHAVSVTETKFHTDIAERFTPGTPDVASMVGLAAACNYLDTIGMQQVAEHDQALVAYALDKLAHHPKITLVGPLDATKRVGSVAFLYQGVHAHDVAQVLSSEKIYIRSGHHCTMPLHLHFDWQATLRASFNVYSTSADIDALLLGLDKVEDVFSK